MHKSFPKILIILFLTVFILQIICLFFLLAVPTASQAADPATFKPQVEIPGMKEEFGATDKTGGYAIPGSTASIAKYIRVVYKYAIGIVGILAAVVLMIGGVLWIIAGGNATTIGEAKAWIGASLTGLLLALTSYLILATVNPALVDLKTTGIQTVEKTLTPKSQAEIENKCNAECPNPGGWQYDPATNKCNCYGSGKHKECQSVYDVSGNKTIKCVEVPYAGADTCVNDASCEEAIQGCCLSNRSFSGNMTYGYRQCSDTTKKNCAYIDGSNFQAGKKCWSTTFLGMSIGTYYCQ